MCDRCKVNPGTKYTLVKDGSKRETVLCGDCAAITRTIHTLSGGKTPEALPSVPEPEASETESSITRSARGRRS